MSHAILRRDQQGSMMVAVLALIILSLGAAGFLIDSLLASRVSRDLQRSADATSLAIGYALLSTDLPPAEKWTKAKRAGIALLRNNSIYSVPGIFGGAGELGTTQQNSPDPYEASLYRYSRFTWEAGGRQITALIERGYYLNGQFYSLESEGGFSAESGGQLYCRHIPIPECVPTAEVTTIANAARVTLTLNTLRTSFASLFGIGSIDNLTRSAVAAPDL